MTNAGVISTEQSAWVPPASPTLQGAEVLAFWGDSNPIASGLCTHSPFIPPSPSQNVGFHATGQIMPSDKPITIACDACRRRKVKCDALQPCNRCESAGIACRTTSVRRKKGRQGATATVLHELRKAPERTEAPSFPLTGPFDQFTRQPRLLRAPVVQSCAEYFFARMLGTVPILLPGTFQSHVDRMAESLPSYCLVSAFCAFVFTQTGYASSLSAADSASTGTLGRQLLTEAMAARRHLDPFAAPTRVGITIAFLLYGCQIGLGNQRQAYYFLREATTLYTAGMLDQADTGIDEDAGSLFWLLLISER
jgi:alpha-glucosidase